MSGPVIFKDLPATFPEEDKYKKSSFVSSLIFHGVLIAAVVVIPLLIPQALPGRELWITLVAPLPAPPAAAPAPPARLPVASAPRPVDRPDVSARPDMIVMPVEVPRDLVRIIDAPNGPQTGVAGGIPGGIPGGVTGGILGGVLSENSIATVLPPAPPPPPPPPPPPKLVAAGPVRVGGMVKEPRSLKIVPPIYPPIASRARVSGIVVLEATLTMQGTVEAIRVISGHPLLTQAAIDCVKQWRYEPTLLNGVPVSVIMTATVRFEKSAFS